jgi:replicative DNA helicase
MNPPLQPRGNDTRTRRFRHKRGERVGRWTLAQQLGAGGNGEVWEANDDQTGEIAAVKILHTRDRDQERYERFRREINALQTLGPGGILPLIDFALPASLKEGPVWYSMPVARGLRIALSNKPLGDVVGAIAELSLTLAELAKRGVHHRDVKPENLYSYAGGYVLGDFGLVLRQGDESITAEHRFPGPFDYLPSEAILRWESADFEKVDLFCLAKTLWVLVANEDRPPRGRLNRDDRYALSRVLSSDTRSLDAVLESATADDPVARPTLSAFHGELLAWLETASPMTLGRRTGVTETVARTGSSMTALRGPSNSTEIQFAPIHDLLLSHWQRVANLYETGASGALMTTGLRCVDEFIGGLPDVGLSAIGGRPSIGKTSVALRIAEHVALELARPVAYLTASEDREEITSRLLGSIAKVEMARLRTGRLDTNDWPRAANAADRLDKAPIHIAEVVGGDVDGLASAIRRHAESAVKPDLVVVDPLTPFVPPDGDAGHGLYAALRKLAELAQDVGTSLLVTVGLPDDLEKREDPRPRISDLHWPMAAHRLVEVLLLVYRDDYYFDDPERAGIAELLVCKNRLELGVAHLAFLARYARFVDFAE